MSRLDLFRSFLFSVLFLLLVWDGLLWLMGPVHQLPQLHRELLLTGFLVWFVSVFVKGHHDDDLAGEF